MKFFRSEMTPPPLSEIFRKFIRIRGDRLPLVDRPTQLIHIGISTKDILQIVCNSIFNILSKILRAVVV